MYMVNIIGIKNMTIVSMVLYASHAFCSRDTHVTPYFTTSDHYPVFVNVTRRE